jgi:formate hydrogenlyase subunit 4
MSDALLQLLHMALALALAPTLTGVVRVTKARLLGRRGPSVWQPYRDLARLMRKEAVVAESASWLFLSAPYLVFAAIWLAAALVPGLALGLSLGPTADLIVLVALLGAARFFTALAGMDVGTSFGGIGSSREMMIATLAEPAMLMVIFTLALWAGSTSIAHIAGFILARDLGVQVSLAMALVAMLMVAMAENARIPVDNPATHLELTMVHEAMVLEYSGRHLALMEAAAMLKLLVYVSLILCLFAPWGLASPGAGLVDLAAAMSAYVLKLVGAGVALGTFEVSIAKMRVFRVAEFLGGALLLAVLATIFLYVARAL